MSDKKHIVCYSGGHSSALVAIEVSRRYGTDGLVLLNHDINFFVEHSDIKRFKQEVAEYIGVPLTFANRRNVEQDQFDVCVEASAFKVNNGQELCTSRLKTEPFMNWLDVNVPNKDAIIYYGFDANEQHRIQRRSGIMGSQGWQTDFPLIWKERTITSTEEINILRPSTYSVFKHGNCVGCLKAGWQHWYIVYCTRQDIWQKAKWAEDEIGHAIHHDDSGPVYLEDMELTFQKMKAASVPATEHIPHQKFWANAKRVIRIKPQMEISFPCECTESPLTDANEIHYNSEIKLAQAIEAKKENKHE